VGKTAWLRVDCGVFLIEFNSVWCVLIEQVGAWIEFGVKESPTDFFVGTFRNG
jgi:hypothetical protein